MKNFLQFFWKKWLTFLLFFAIIRKSSREMTDMRKCRNWQTSKTKDLVTIAVVWVQVPSSASKDLNLWLGSFLRTETWTQGSYLRFAPVGANPRSTVSRAPHLPHYLIWCGSLIIKASALFLFLNCLSALEHVHIRHFATDCCFVGRYLHIHHVLPPQTHHVPCL